MLIARVEFRPGAGDVPASRVAWDAELNEPGMACLAAFSDLLRFSIDDYCFVVLNVVQDQWLIVEAIADKIGILIAFA